MTARPNRCGNRLPVNHLPVNPEAASFNRYRWRWLNGKNWSEQNPYAEVLTIADIKTDRYMKEAYADYAESDQLYMAVSATDARLHPKRVIYALEIGEQAIAIDSEWLAEQGQWSEQFKWPGPRGDIR